MQNKQKKKDTFYNNLKCWLFGDFINLKILLRRIPHRNLEIDKGRIEIGKNPCSQICLFLPEIVKILKKNYKITVIDRTLISNTKNSDNSITKWGSYSVFKNVYNEGNNQVVLIK